VNVTIATNKTELNTAITDAEAYYNSISETNPDAAATLLEAINTAKGVQGNADATQTEIETATTTLNDAVDAAKADVALKRVTIVIPAKSYVARVDADKRQIENAVAGVKLYSVASVTNSEVVLTDELTVVDAAMPYLIYNDNDEEKTISIVVSSNAADNVTVATEFKGTLTAKTFTADDMQAADHYVLNGKNFVWVKNAGTLSAGKCWIELAKSAGASRLSIVFGESTGIAGVSVEGAEHTGWYDLSGRRVAKPAKGVYVKDGKKIVVK
jgi:flagellar hook-basal body complex protein FliE